MPRRSSEGELESLRAQHAALTEKIKETEARARAKRAAEEVRRNLLAGAAVLGHAEKDSEFAKTLLSLIDRAARSAADRALFGLQPIAAGHQAADDGSANKRAAGESA